MLENLASHEFEIHAGRNYWGFGLADGLKAKGAKVDIPTDGIGMLGLAAFYGDSPPSQLKSVGREKGKPMTGSYEPLRRYLEEARGDKVELSFADLEVILDRSLPVSAHNHRAWWANHVGTHSHARSWLEVGWEVGQVNLTAGRVTFKRASSA